MKQLKNPKFAASVQAFENACKCMQQHTRLVRTSLKKYGDHGAYISGVFRDHFPEAVKEKLRGYLREASAWDTEGFRVRPPRTRFETLRAIRRVLKQKYDV